MSAININHKKETITTENDHIVKIGEDGALKIGNGTTVGAGGNKGVLRVNQTTNELEISDGSVYRKVLNTGDQIGEANIADNSISTDKLQNGSVTLEKLATIIAVDALDKNLNLSDLTNVSDARANLGLGSASLLDGSLLLTKSNNLSDVQNSSTALSNLNGVPTAREVNTGSGLAGGGNLTENRTLSVDSSVARTSRQINTGVGLTGGGDLSDNRTISAVIPTKEEAEAGTINNKLMTPLRVAEAIQANSSDNVIHFYMMADRGGTVEGGSSSTNVVGVASQSVVLSSTFFKPNGIYLLSDFETMICFRRRWARFNSGATYINCLLEADTESGWSPLKAWSNPISHGANPPTGDLDLYTKYPNSETMVYSTRGINGPIIFSANPRLRLTVSLSNSLPTPISIENGSYSNSINLANQSNITMPTPVETINLIPVAGVPSGWQFGWYGGGMVKGNLIYINTATLPSSGWNMGNPSGSGGHSDWSTWIGK